MGPTWVLSAPGGPHVWPTNLPITVCMPLCHYEKTDKHIRVYRLHRRWTFHNFPQRFSVEWSRNSFQGSYLKGYSLSCHNTRDTTHLSKSNGSAFSTIKVVLSRSVKLAGYWTLDIGHSNIQCLKSGIRCVKLAIYPNCMVHFFDGTLGKEREVSRVFDIGHWAFECPMSNTNIRLTSRSCFIYGCII